MEEAQRFLNREEFRKWLDKHCLSKDGIWLLFGKAGGLETITANEALEEALCFGWIDGQIKSIDDTAYKKYFTLRRENSKWSEKNKALVLRLEKKGIMTDYGRRKIEEAKRSGAWSNPKPETITDDQITSLAVILKEYEPAHTNFMSMSPSARRTYTRAYFDAKTDAGRSKRISWMVERLNQNLKPM